MTTKDVKFENGKFYKFVNRYTGLSDTVSYFFVAARFYVVVSVYSNGNVNYYNGSRELDYYNAADFIPDWYKSYNFDEICECSRKEMDKAFREYLKVAAVNYTKYTNASKED